MRYKLQWSIIPITFLIVFWTLVLLPIKGYSGDVHFGGGGKGQVFKVVVNYDVGMPELAYYPAMSGSTEITQFNNDFEYSDGYPGWVEDADGKDIPHGWVCGLEYPGWGSLDGTNTCDSLTTLQHDGSTGLVWHIDHDSYVGGPGYVAFNRSPYEIPLADTQPNSLLRTTIWLKIIDAFVNHDLETPGLSRDTELDLSIRFQPSGTATKECCGNDLYLNNQYNLGDVGTFDWTQIPFWHATPESCAMRLHFIVGDTVELYFEEIETKYFEWADDVLEDPTLTRPQEIPSGFFSLDHLGFLPVTQPDVQRAYVDTFKNNFARFSPCTTKAGARIWSFSGDTTAVGLYTALNMPAQIAFVDSLNFDSVMLCIYDYEAIQAAGDSVEFNFKRSAEPVLTYIKDHLPGWTTKLNRIELFNEPAVIWPPDRYALMYDSVVDSCQTWLTDNGQAADYCDFGIIESVLWGTPIQVFQDQVFKAIDFEDNFDFSAIHWYDIMGSSALGPIPDTTWALSQALGIEHNSTGTNVSKFCRQYWQYLGKTPEDYYTLIGEHGLINAYDDARATEHENTLVGALYIADLYIECLKSIRYGMGGYYMRSIRAYQPDNVDGDLLTRDVVAPVDSLYPKPRFYSWMLLANSAVDSVCLSTISIDTSHTRHVYNSADVAPFDVCDENDRTQTGLANVEHAHFINAVACKNVAEDSLIVFAVNKGDSTVTLNIEFSNFTADSCEVTYLGKDNNYADENSPIHRNVYYEQEILHVRGQELYISMPASTVAKIKLFD